MADNYTAKDSGGTVKTFDAKDIGAGVLRPRAEVSSVPDGADVAEGLTTDAAVTGDNPGTLSAKARGLNKRWGLDIPVGVGQKAMNASLAVVIASDQTPLQIAAGANAIGLVKDNGPANAPSPIAVTSADASGGVNLTGLPGTGLKIVVDDLIISVGTGCEVFLYQDTIAGTYLGGFLLAANAPVSLCSLRDGIRCLVADKRMVVKTSPASTLRALGGYHSE